MISNQVERMLRPLLQPLTSPLRVDAQKSTHTTVAMTAVTPPTVDLASLMPHSIPASPKIISAAPAVETAANNAGASVVSFANAPLQTSWSNTGGLNGAVAQCIARRQRCR